MLSRGRKAEKGVFKVWLLQGAYSDVIYCSHKYANNSKLILKAVKKDECLACCSYGSRGKIIYISNASFFSPGNSKLPLLL